ncbi:MAG: orotidine-5'-phosphate decarboxylase [Burkholderiales bacterium]|nr:orotidine-5'-phosphate decarboxylase [Burkholderiales bacterium]
MLNTKPVIIVLDYPDAKSALDFAAHLDPAACRVKVGKELHTAAGPQMVDALMHRGFDVFLDLKFHDIPNTVASACRVAASQGVWMLNVHASGGSRMMLAACEAVDFASARPLLIGVTVLTSLSDAELPEIGLVGSTADNVLRLAALTKACGLDGVVCSAQEAPSLKVALGGAFQLVTPGIRLEGDSKGDQQRVVTPLDAIKMGADYLVIGRSISHASNPVATLQDINQQLAALRASAVLA